MAGWERGKLVVVSVGGMFALSMCGSKAGTEVEGGGGYGRYSVSGCGVRKDFAEAGYKAGIHHQTKSGFAIGADGGATRRELVAYHDDNPAPDDPLEGEIEDIAYAGLRAGYHSTWFGFEAGAVAYFDGATIDPGDPTGPIGMSALRPDGEMIILPAGEAWSGKKDGLFLWAEVLRDFDSTREVAPIGVGIGHESWIHARGGLTLQGLTAEVAVPLGGADAPVCVGVKALVSENDSYWVGGTLRYRFGDAPRKPKVIKPNPKRSPPAPAPTAVPEQTPEPAPDAPPPPEETPAPERN